MMTMNKTHVIKDNSRAPLHKYTHQSSSQSTRFSASLSFFLYSNMTMTTTTTTDNNTKANVV